VPPADQRTRASRVTALVAVALVAVGSCGGMDSFIRATGGSEIPAAPMVSEESDPQASEATENLQRAIQETLSRAPLQETLDGVNVALSLLLVVAGMMLLLRRRNAVWWVTQAAVANALWTAGQMTSQVWQLQASSDELEMVIERHEATGGPIQGTYYLVAVFVGLALVRVLAYAWVAWRVRRPDVADLIEDAEAQRRG